jgi:hypothetical protein
MPATVVEVAKALLDGDDPRTLFHGGAIDFSEGEELVRLFFHGDWCRRRVLRLEFIQERRGEWTVNIDFRIPEELGQIGLLHTDHEVFVPILTFSKDYMPRAHVTTSDERGDKFSIAPVADSRVMTTAMLLTMAAQAGFCLKHLSGTVSAISSADHRRARTAYEALFRDEDGLDDHGDPLPRGTCPCISAPAVGHAAYLHGRDPVHDFLMAAKLLHRSIVLLAEFPANSVGKRKVVEMTYDGPIRITKTTPEHAGRSPLRVVPRAIFGGDAQSYHIQVQPPENLVAVDTRVLYLYEGTRKRPPTSDVHQVPLLEQEYELVDEDGWWRKVAATKNGNTLASRQTRYKRWWGCVQGSAEPMAAHVRCGSDRLPRMIDGRDVFAMVQFYPQAAGLISEMLTAALANILFIAVLVAGLVWTHGLVHAVDSGGEAILIIGVLVGGLGAGFTFYPKEHVLTTQVARPWRVLVALSVVFTIAALVTCIWNAPPEGGTHLASGTARALQIELGLAVVFGLYLVYISYRAWWAQAAGFRMLWDRQGLLLRRREFHSFRSVDDRAAERSAYWQWGAEVKLNHLKKYAETYLLEDHRRELFNRGVPPAVRHQMSQRGS